MCVEVHAVDPGDQGRDDHERRRRRRSCACPRSASPRSARGGRRRPSTAAGRARPRSRRPWLRWSRTSRKNGAASSSIPGTAPVAKRRIGSRSGHDRAARLGDLALEGVDAGRVVGALRRRTPRSRPRRRPPRATPSPTGSRRRRGRTRRTRPPTGRG